VDPDHIRELFIEFGPIVVRRMFGAAGLYADGVMFDLVSGGQIYLKADAATAAAFEREGCAPFRIRHQDRQARIETGNLRPACAEPRFQFRIGEFHLLRGVH
jgi:TfoX/Sxy family transcriptional regulator of competence genes